MKKKAQKNQVKKGSRTVLEGFWTFLAGFLA